ncbi:MAG: DUF5916 domain-containing protein [Bacteroidales bacterium]|nr:DUF5916 domain-containing protein [Bacteroidales bacterium]
MIRQIFLYLILSLTALTTVAQKQSRDIAAHRTYITPKIDGKLDEAAWQDAPIADNFVQYNPYNGARPSQPTVIRIMYDDRAIYVGAMMYDSSPDSIYRELGERDDDNINSDFLTVDILPYNDGLNAFEFKVFASGVEGDTKHAANYRDQNWDPIWKSAVEITDSGWVAEIEIPYAAIRFTKKEEQVWGLNFWRNIRRHREFSTWNYIDNKQDGVFNQYGTMSGIRDIMPPLRLFFIPYVAGYTEKMPEADGWSYSYNYGLDMKLGLSESFTLDMTLVPDFGQVQSDDQIVNLSPFETYYQERRPFFTEGTELFERGDIFYTRRVGGTPRGFNTIQKGEIDSLYWIKDNPEEIQLLNAIKISGRNRNGTAIGVFNAVNANTHAIVVDSTDEEKKILTHPASNYNMVVFDQNLKNNSYVSLYNTNVYRGRNEYVANVSGTEFEVRNKTDMWSVGGIFNVSQKYNPDARPDFGHALSLEAGKVSGNFRFALSHQTQNDTYDINDMGFNSRNNRFNHELELEYNIYDPVGILIDMRNEFSIDYNMLYEPRKYTYFGLGYDNRTTFKNYLTAGMDLRINPVNEHDYFEPRVEGRYIKYPANGLISIFLSPDYRKRFIVDFSAGAWGAVEYIGLRYSGYRASLKPRLRVNDRFSVKLQSMYKTDFNSIGYIDDTLSSANENVIIMGIRDIQTVENLIDLKYIFTKNMALTLRARHYWFKVDYSDYYRLNENGGLEESDYDKYNDFVFNAFNIDMVYRWTFAPASELIFTWKNNIYAEKSDIVNNYFNDVRYTFSSPMGNSFSLKVLYYLDYQSLRKKNRKIEG